MKHSVESFKVLKKCVTEYDTKIQEALVIKKLNSKLNKQLDNNNNNVTVQHNCATVKKSKEKRRKEKAIVHHTKCIPVLC